MSKVYHTLEPIYNENSKTLILGSMPSVKSRENYKYYGNKNNRFWKVLEEVYKEDTTNWKEFILKHNLALWDVIKSCDIKGSSDSSIKNIEINDVMSIINKSKIQNIFLLGKTAYNLYNKYLYPKTNIEGIYLPSPSSANASVSFDDLVKSYEAIKKITE
jgi:hypoxanthine-DNA glycosylase